MLRRARLLTLGALAALLALAAVACADDPEPTGEADPSGDDGAAEEEGEAPNEDEDADPIGEPADDGHDDHGAEHADEEESEVEEVPDPQVRLVVADAEEPIVRVIDLLEETTVAEFEVAEAGATLTPEPSGRVVAASQPGADVVHFVDTGSFAVDHGDHAHYYVTEPRLLDTVLEAANPSHALGVAGAIAVFADDDATGHVVDVDALLDDDVAAQTADTGGVHHGSVAPLGDGDLVATSGPADGQDHGLADEVWVHDGDDVVDTYDCPDLHGVTADGDWAAFPCDDGILVLTDDDGEVTDRKIDYPGERVWYLRTDPGSGLVAAASGTTMVIADVTTGEAETVDLPAPVAERSAVDADGHALVLDEAGIVHQIDLAEAELVASSEEPITVDESGPRATIVGGRDRVYVPVTSEGVVHEFATNDDLRLARTIDVDGAPGTLAWAGAVVR